MHDCSKLSKLIYINPGKICMRLKLDINIYRTIDVLLPNRPYIIGFKFGLYCWIGLFHVILLTFIFYHDAISELFGTCSCYICLLPCLERLYAKFLQRIFSIISNGLSINTTDIIRMAMEFISLKRNNVIVYIPRNDGCTMIHCQALLSVASVGSLLPMHPGFKGVYLHRHCK